MEGDKSDLSHAIYIQNCGEVTYAPIFHQFVHHVAAEVRKQFNYEKYSEHGKDCFKVVNNMVHNIMQFFFFECEKGTS